MEAIQKLLEWVEKGWELLICWTIVDPYEGGVILRLGKYSRTLKPGWNWKWPMIERPCAVNVCTTTMRLQTQTLTTLDGVSVAVGVIAKYEINDVREFICNIWDSADVLADTVMGAVKAVVSSLGAAELLTQSHIAEARVTELSRKDVNRFGFKLHRVTFIELAKTKSLRIMQDFNASGHS